MNGLQKIDKYEVGDLCESSVMHIIKSDTFITDIVDLLLRVIEDRELDLWKMQQNLVIEEHNAHEKKIWKIESFWLRWRSATRVSRDPQNSFSNWF